MDEAEAGIADAKEKGDLTARARLIKEARETVVYLGKTVGLWSDRPQTYIDNRKQTLAISGLTTEELRSLARLDRALPETIEGEAC